MILVTGAAGLTGSFVVAELVRRGIGVRALHRAAPPAPLPAGVEIVLGDLADPGSLARAARGATGIVHTACTYTDTRIDIAAMALLVEAWDAGPFVFLSTLDVYGLVSGTVTEDTPTTEHFTDYARGKVVCERILAERGRSDFVSLRAPYIWGPHPTARRRLLEQRVRDGALIVLPGANEDEWSRYRDAWVDVRDLATITAASLDRPTGGPLNVATGHVSYHDLYTELIRLTNSRSAIVHRPLELITDAELPNKQLRAQTWTFSEDKLERTIGPIARYSLVETLRATVCGTP